MQDTCIFCPQTLDGSDEHIIPESINGKLHSKSIICSRCNNLFGTRLDPVVKETFGFLLHVLKIGSGRKLEVYDEDGGAYHVDNQTGRVTMVKAEVTVEKLQDGKMRLSVQGNDEKKVVIALAKKAIRMFGRAAMKGEFSIKRELGFRGPLSAHAEIRLSPKLHLMLYKILLEFWCHSGLERKWIISLLNKIGRFDEEVPELQICNTEHQVRMPVGDEISHLIVIRSDHEKKIVYGYLELFNTLCAYTVLVEGYEGDQIDLVYHQDAVNSKVLNNPIVLNLEKITETSDDFQHNLNKLFIREEDRRVKAHIFEIGNRVKKEMDIEFANVEISKEAYDRALVERLAQAAAEYMTWTNPYAFTDHDTQNLKKINYLHSVIIADRKADFEFFYQQFIGKEFLIEDTKISHVLEKFIYSDHRPVNEKPTYKVYCCYISRKDGSISYGLASNLFHSLGMPFMPEAFTWL